MPTFTDPVADAAEASEALRGLAHATRSVDQPQDMYGMLGDLLAGVRALEQVLEQLATAHDDEDRAAGRQHAVQAAAELRDAAALIGQAEARVNAGTAAAGRIAWQPPSGIPVQGPYVNIVFLQGEEADPLTELAARGETDAVIRELAGHDFGDETVQAALENGYVYDEPPTSVLDRTAELDVYTLVYNPFMGHLGLYRRERELPTPALLGVDDVQPAPGEASARAVTSGAEPRRSRREQLGDPDLGGLELDPAHVRGFAR